MFDLETRCSYTKSTIKRFCEYLCVGYKPILKWPPDLIATTYPQPCQKGKICACLNFETMLGGYPLLNIPIDTCIGSLKKIKIILASY
jgi:hypothetical protein